MVELAGTTWRAERIAGQRALVDNQPDVTFEADGSAHGHASVNRFRATWTLDGDTLAFGPGMTTMMAGPPAAMEQEQRWLSLFERPLNIRLEEPHLVIDSDGTTSRLRRVPLLVVSGSVLYRERIAMPGGAVVLVELRDTARADAPAPLLAQQVIEQPSNVPVAFALRVERDALAAPARPSLSARLNVGDELWWVTDTHHPVLAEDADGHELILVRVAST